MQICDKYFVKSYFNFRPWKGKNIFALMIMMKNITIFIVCQMDILRKMEAFGIQFAAHRLSMTDRLNNIPYDFLFAYLLNVFVLGIVLNILQFYH